MNTFFKVIALSLIITGCGTTQKYWSAIDGSKANGTVTLAFEHGAFETPAVDNAQGQRIATDRCKAWGYQSAEEFGGGTTLCLRPGQSFCHLTQVTKKYQCLDK